MANSKQAAETRKLRKTAVGIVTSAHKTPKTVRVETRFQVRHAKYGKYVRKLMRLHVHDENAEAQPGDRVQVMECRPISKSKVWRLVKVLERAADM